MSVGIITGLLALVGVVLVFLFMARRALRWAVRLALLGVVLLALLLGAVAWWWYGLGGPAHTPQRENRPGANRRANSR